MAIFKPGPTVAAISGKLGGCVYSHNRGGAYIRNFAVPANPSSSYQQNIRAIMAERSAEWRALTAAQRLSWANYANQNPITNALGEAYTMSGHQAYVQLNTRLVYAADTVITAPPITTAPSALLTLTVTADISDAKIELGFTTTPLGADARLWVTACLVDSAGIAYVKNLLRTVVVSAKAQATLFNIKANVEARFGAMVLAQAVHVRAAVFDTTTGLLSIPRAADTIVAA